MSKKRIMHIVEAPGGVERYLVTLLTKMQKYNDYEHILVCSSSFDLKKFTYITDGIEVIPTMHHEISLVGDSKAILDVRKVIKKHKPDIVYCHSSKAGAIGRIADVGLKNKLIYNAHGWAFNMKGIGRKKIKLYEMVEKTLSVMTDKIICISGFEKKSALDHRICKEEKLQIINNGIDFSEYDNRRQKTRKQLGIPEDAFIVGTVGRLTTQKSPDVFVKMAEIVKNRIPKAYFLMVGDGEQSEEIWTQVGLADLSDSFNITGSVDDPLTYACCFDVAVLLSRWEGFGLVLPEYMLIEKPIVATKADAIPYVVGDAGLLVNVDDYSDAAKAVIRLYEDQELRKQLTGKGKKRVKLFDAQRTADEHVALFREQEDAF